MRPNTIDPTEARFSWFPLMTYSIHFCECFFDPIRDEAAHGFHVVSAAVLDTAFVLREDLQLPFRAIGRFIERLMCIPERNLSIPCAVRDQERDSDLVHYADE